MRHWFPAFICLLASTASADDLTGREELNATLWMQHAPEYRAVTLQSYRAAAALLAAPPAGSVAVEQDNVPADALARLPTAVILDVDETVLDNSVYQARLLRDRAEYDSKSWGAWVGEGRAPALPGVREFIAAARRLGHTVFYITNRDCSSPPATGADPCPAKTATARNLETLGIEEKVDPSRLMLRGEKPEWAAKTARRAAIAANYRIVMLVGDDLGDFTEPARFAADRERLEKRFGAGWVALPNPMYGSWLNPYESLAQKFAGLVTEPEVLALPNARRWQGDAKQVRVATWNVEYLVTPETRAALANNCAENGGRVGGDARVLPCAITKRAPRTPEDFAALRRYAAELNPDIVALQEVDGPEAAALVFPGYEYCFSTRGHVQKNGFAIRRGLPFRCESEYAPLALETNEVRRGVVATFFPGTANEFRLMSVHMKSGCPEGPLTSDRIQCQVLAKQMAPLEAWIETQATEGRRFGLLGDFNRRFSKEKGGARDTEGRQLNVFAEINDGEPAASKLTDITAGRRFIGCTTDSEYKEYIDTLLIGSELAKSMLKRNFVRLKYDDAEAKERWLSDHCPVGIEFSLR
jgi:5'-nucleotidase (lipoprotein e(P4) family)